MNLKPSQEVPSMNSKAPNNLTLKSWDAPGVSALVTDAVRAGFLRGWGDAVAAMQPEIRGVIQERELALRKRCETVIEVVLASARAEVGKARQGGGNGEGIDRLCGLLEELLARDPVAPVVNVAAPSVTIEQPEKKATIKEVRRDKWGQIADVIERPMTEADFK